MSFELSMTTERNPICYTLKMTPSGVAHEIEEETLTQQQTPKPSPFKFIQSQGSDIRYRNMGSQRVERPTWEHNPLETSLSQVPKMYRQPEEFRKRLESSTH
jgi:predicted ATPase